MHSAPILVICWRSSPLPVGQGLRYIVWPPLVAAGLHPVSSFPLVECPVQISGICERWYFRGKFLSHGIWEHVVVARSCSEGYEFRQGMITCMYTGCMHGVVRGAHSSAVSLSPVPEGMSLWL